MILENSRDEWADGNRDIHTQNQINEDYNNLTLVNFIPFNNLSKHLWSIAVPCNLCCVIGVGESVGSFDPSNIDDDAIPIQYYYYGTISRIGGERDRGLGYYEVRSTITHTHYYNNLPK